LLEEASDVAIRARSTELSKPNLAHAVGIGRGDDVLHVLFEVGKIGGICIPMEGDKVDFAFAIAGLEEGVEPIDPHQWTCPGTVGDGRRSDLGLASQWVHVFDVVGGSSFRVDVGLRAEVRLVEAQHVATTAGNSRRSSASPGVDGIETPEHGDVLCTRDDAAIRSIAPVVRPGDTLAGESIGQ